MSLFYKIKSFYYDCRRFLLNLKWMIPAAWKFCCWDCSYNLGLFATSLEITAKNIKKYGNSVNKEKTYRRAMHIAARLKRLDNFHMSYDKSYINWSTKTKSQVYCMLGFSDGSYSEQYSDKMFKIIRNRIDKAREEFKKDTWNLIAKYHESIWD